jgi:WD40 repeat protein
MKRLILFILLIPLSAFAVTVSHWVHTNEADFKPGTFHDVVVTNLGDLKLSRAVKTLLDQDPKISTVYSLVEASDGTIYAGTGPQGVLLQIKEDKVSTATHLEDGTSIFSLLIDQEGGVLLGTGGEKGKIYRIDKPGEKPHAIFESDGVQYIWAMALTPDGNLYAATGPNGKLFEIKPDGTHKTILETDENNLLSMISDGKDTLYVGTDPNGLVYRVNRKTGESFVLYDAVESEVSALALDAKGNLYVGTAEATEQATPATEEVTKEKIGRPEGTAGGVPIQAEPPTNPQPPQVPNPNPGQPDPIPKKLMILIDPKKMDDPDGGADPGNPPAPPAPNPGNPKHPGQTGADSKTTTPPTPTQGINTTGTGQPRPEGNAIYRIDPNGFVTEIFRQPVLVFSIVEKDGTLLVGTGSDGLVYQVNPDADETVVIAKVDPKQVTRLLPTRDGRIIMGLANVGGIAALGSGYADEGDYTSRVLDAVQISKFGKIEMHGSLPSGTSLKIATRSGNVKEPTETSWSKWSTAQSATEFVQTDSPPARFFQYRLTFATKDAAVSPVVEDVDAAYLMPNLPPQVKDVKVTLGGKTTPPTPPPDPDANSLTVPTPLGRIQTINWDASDPNNDALLYTLSYRSGNSGPWILLKDKLKDTSFEWDTRAVADGRYQIKVTASDAAANPAGEGKTTSRISDPILVDNTPPVVGDVKTTIKGSAVNVDLKAVDRTSTVAAVDFSVDSSQDWQAATPSDSMFDGPEATATFNVEKLSPGPHQITVRATDARGNQGFENIFVTIEPAAVSK